MMRVWRSITQECPDDASWRNGPVVPALVLLGLMLLAGFAGVR